MASAAQRIAGLEQQLAALMGRFEQLEREAFFVKTIEQVIAERAGYSTGPRAALKASPRRHLHVVEGAR
jgi:hypothetical protein